MNQFNFQTAEYVVCGLENMKLSEALRFWKAKYETIAHFRRDVIKHPALDELGRFVQEVWEDVAPITVSEALLEQNQEKRRTMFDCIGVSRLFKELKPELLDKQVIEKVRTRWNEQNQPYQHQFNDTYELYRIDGEKLFIPRNEWNTPNSVYAVRCWCTTTGREYWIYVPEGAAIGSRFQKHDRFPNPDAIRAIAWTIRLDVSDPKRIYRQGDIIIVEESETSQTVPQYHLGKEAYLNLMYSET